MKYTQLYYTDIQHIVYISYNIFQIPKDKCKANAFYMFCAGAFRAVAAHEKRFDSTVRRDFRKKERRQPDISPLFLHRQYDLSE